MNEKIKNTDKSLEELNDMKKSLGDSEDNNDTPKPTTELYTLLVEQKEAYSLCIEHIANVINPNINNLINDDDDDDEISDSISSLDSISKE